MRCIHITGALRPFVVGIVNLTTTDSDRYVASASFVSLLLSSQVLTSGHLDCRRFCVLHWLVSVLLRHFESCQVAHCEFVTFDVGAVIVNFILRFTAE